MTLLPPSVQTGSIDLAGERRCGGRSCHWNPFHRCCGAPMQEGYAVGYFESWNLESLQGVVDAAEQTMSPVILGFNGGFLSGPRHATERLSWYAALGRAAAESSSVPCGLIFNECPRDDWVRSAIAAGFNLVMLADPEASPEDLTSRIAALTRLAHASGVAVEAEVGELPCAASGQVTGGVIDRPGNGRGVRRGNRGRPFGCQRRQCPHPDRGRARSRLTPAGSDSRACFAAARAPRRNGHRRRSITRSHRTWCGQGQLRDLPQARLSQGGQSGTRPDAARPTSPAWHGRPGGCAGCWTTRGTKCRAPAHRPSRLLRESGASMFHSVPM